MHLKTSTSSLATAVATASYRPARSAASVVSAADGVRTLRYAPLLERLLVVMMQFMPIVVG